MRRLSVVCGAIIGCLVTVPVQAQHYEGGSWRVTGYRTGVDGSLFTLSPPPTGCGGGSSYGEHINIADNAPHREEIIASLMSAYLAGEYLSGLWYRNDGPCSPSSPLDVYMIRMKAK